MANLEEYLSTRRTIISRYYRTKDTKQIYRFDDQLNWFSEYPYRNSGFNDKRTTSEQYKPKVGFFKSFYSKVNSALTKEHGVYHTRFNTGQLYSEINFQDGKKQELWRWWHRNGNLRGASEYNDYEIEKRVKMEIRLSDNSEFSDESVRNDQIRSKHYQSHGYGKPINIEREWYDNGLVKQERRWFHGKVCAELNYHQSGEEIKSTIPSTTEMIPIESTVEVESFYPPITYIVLTDDRILATGVVFENFKSGKRKFEGAFVNGLRQGKHRTWYENGNVETETDWKDGLMHGFERIWEKGSLYEYAYYLGLKDGASKIFREAGNLTSHSEYLDGMQHGVDYDYYDNGQIKRETVYFEREMLGMKTWFKNGKLKEEGTLSNRERGLDTYRRRWDELGNLVSTFQVSELGEGNLIKLQEIKSLMEFEARNRNR